MAPHTAVRVPGLPPPDGTTFALGLAELGELVAERNGSDDLVRANPGDRDGLGCLALMLLPERETVGLRSGPLTAPGDTARFPAGCDGIEDVRAALPEAFREAVLRAAGGGEWRWSRDELRALGCGGELRLDATFNGFDYARRPLSLTVTGATEPLRYSFTQLFHQRDKRRAAAGRE